MSGPRSEHDRNRLRTELGLMRLEGIGHLLSDGDYLGFNEGDHRGAIAAYEKAWRLLDTPWQRRTGGVEILEGIADFALSSEDPELARETLNSLTPRAEQIASKNLRTACDKLALLAGEPK